MHTGVCPRMQSTSPCRKGPRGQQEDASSIRKEEKCHPMPHSLPVPTQGWTPPADQDPAPKSCPALQATTTPLTTQLEPHRSAALTSPCPHPHINPSTQLAPTCFWSPCRPFSFCSRRRAARSHCWARCRILFFMKLRDSLPVPTSSSNGARSLRKAACRNGALLIAIRHHRIT